MLRRLPWKFSCVDLENIWSYRYAPPCPERIVGFFRQMKCSVVGDESLPMATLKESLLTSHENLKLH